MEKIESKLNQEGMTFDQLPPNERMYYHEFWMFIIVLLIYGRIQDTLEEMGSINSDQKSYTKFYDLMIVFVITTYLFTVYFKNKI